MNRFAFVFLYKELTVEICPRILDTTSKELGRKSGCFRKYSINVASAEQLPKLIYLIKHLLYVLGDRGRVAQCFRCCATN